MATINYYGVINELHKNNWQLLSTSYQNLKTPLNMKCPNGHFVNDTYEHWRKYKRCEVCFANAKVGVIKEEVTKKKDGVYRTLALDASTNVTGYSVYDEDVLISHGLFKTKAEKNTTARINEFKHWLLNMCKTWKVDFIGVENIQLQKFGANANVELYRALANLQGVICDTLYELNIPFELCYPSEWRATCNIVGHNRAQQKINAQQKVKTWYNIQVTEDEADAIAIGKHFVTLRKQPKLSWGEPI